MRRIIAPIIAAIAAVAGLSWWLSRRGGVIEPPLAGEDQVWKWRDYDISFTTAGSGPPLVLIHGLWAGMSSAQWENNFNVLSQQFRVYALDLIGFGRSSKPALTYDAGIYVDLIADFLNEVVEEPAIIVAADHAAPCVIEVAACQPESITRLVLNTPTGLTRFADPPSLGQRLRYRWLRLPVAGTLSYFWTVSKRRLANQLRMEAVEDPSLITPAMIQNAYRQAHQPGAKWAPIAMRCGRLNANVRESYGRLTQPILILWGEMPSSIPISDSREFLSLNGQAVLQTFPDGRLMPEFEFSSKFNAQIQMWAEGKLAA